MAFLDFSGQRAFPCQISAKDLNKNRRYDNKSTKTLAASPTPQPEKNENMNFFQIEFSKNTTSQIFSFCY